MLSLCIRVDRLLNADTNVSSPRSHAVQPSRPQRVNLLCALRRRRQHPLRMSGERGEVHVNSAGEARLVPLVDVWLVDILLRARQRLGKFG